MLTCSLFFSGSFSFPSFLNWTASWLDIQTSSLSKLTSLATFSILWLEYMNTLVTLKATAAAQTSPLNSGLAYPTACLTPPLKFQQAMATQEVQNVAPNCPPKVCSAWSLPQLMATPPFIGSGQKPQSSLIFMSHWHVILKEILLAIFSECTQILSCLRPVLLHSWLKSLCGTGIYCHKLPSRLFPPFFTSLFNSRAHDSLRTKVRSHYNGAQNNPMLTAQVSTDRWTDKQNVACTQNGIFSPKRQENSDICYNMGKPLRHYAKWDKSVTKGQTLN